MAKLRSSDRYFDSAFFISKPFTGSLGNDITRRQKYITALSIAAFAFGGLVVAPRSAVLIHRYRWWETDFISSLEQNLTALGEFYEPMRQSACLSILSVEIAHAL